ncbi:hypothetical protein JCM19314_649 [Nonlabens ulvanivorans]|uniref:Phophatidylinositol-4-phosphate 5-kinase n=2 Tax=Nonlabens ulvanivorans TaxID=906888 RepID=A0A090QDM1_NONUL|nr:toxin-antitoxin system YwqK family antitoxin [Nonlabens ulvanivorans]GAL01205.1 hypothetical protein JCM19314_649 [Nonlabens ulvanivorans]
MHFINRLVSILKCVLICVMFIQCKDSNSVLKEPQELKTVETSTPIAFADYYPSGNIKIKGQLLHDKKTGTWISYFENGDEKSIQNYKNDVLDGFQKILYSQELYMEGNFKQGVKVGTWKSYFKDSQQLKYLKHFDNKGNSTGKWESYYDSGELSLIENHVNNQAHGLQTQYFKNGQISSTGKLVNGKNHGLWNHYYDTGVLQCVKEFKIGVEEGVYKQYYENGTLYKEGTKTNFKKTGVWKTYNRQGTIIETKSYDHP